MSPAVSRPSIFVDADVLIAGSASATGASHAILRLGEFGLVDLVSSEQARIEAERNLGAKLPADLPTFRVICQVACRWVADPTPQTIAGLVGQADKKDIPLLGSALEADCSSLVTFNTRHYKPPKADIRIETPSQFMRRLRAVIADLGR